MLLRRRRALCCSDPTCDRELAPADATRPGCGGTIAGDIAHRDDRLAAEDALTEGWQSRGSPYRG